MNSQNQSPVQSVICSCWSSAALHRSEQMDEIRSTEKNRETNQPCSPVKQEVSTSSNFLQVRSQGLFSFLTFLCQMISGGSLEVLASQPWAALCSDICSHHWGGSGGEDEDEAPAVRDEELLRPVNKTSSLKLLTTQCWTKNGNSETRDETLRWEDRSFPKIFY